MPGLGLGLRSYPPADAQRVVEGGPRQHVDCEHLRERLAVHICTQGWGAADVRDVCGVSARSHTWIG